MSKERSPYWAIAYLLSLPLQIYAWGFTFSTLWGWFLVDAIRVNPIGTWTAMGIMMTVRFATIDWDKQSDTRERDFSTLVMVGFTVPGLFLVIGLVIKYFS